jgi:hypothetical protein
MARAEDLFKEVVVSIVSDRPSVPGDEITELVAPWLEEELTSLVLHRLRPRVLLLFLPRLEQVQHLIDHRPLLWAATFAISCSRWTRFACSTGVLRALVDFELRSIPTHTWGSSTAARLLSPFAWVHHVHQASLESMDLDIFLVPRMDNGPCLHSCLQRALDHGAALGHRQSSPRKDDLNLQHWHMFLFSSVDAVSSGSFRSVGRARGRFRWATVEVPTRPLWDSPSLPFSSQQGWGVRNRTLTLIEREDNTRSWGNFLVYFSHSTTMPCPSRDWGYILIGC